MHTCRRLVGGAEVTGSSPTQTTRHRQCAATPEPARDARERGLHGEAVAHWLTRFGTMGTRLAGLGEEDRGADHELAHST
jgi:hypothetical protein